MENQSFHSFILISFSSTPLLLSLFFVILFKKNSTLTRTSYSIIALIGGFILGLLLVSISEGIDVFFSRPQNPGVFVIYLPIFVFSIIGAVTIVVIEAIRGAIYFIRSK